MSTNADILSVGPSQLTCDHTLPPLYSDVKGMIHLLVGSHVEKPDSVLFSDWSRNNTYETLPSYWLSYLNLTSGQKVGLARKNNMAGTERDFSEDEFSAALVAALRNFHYDSLKLEQIEYLRRIICLCEDVLAVLPTGFEKTRSASPVHTSSLLQHLLDFRAQPKLRLIQIRIFSLDSWVAFVLVLAVLEEYNSPSLDLV